MIVLFNFENMLMINAAVAIHTQDNIKFVFFTRQNNAGHCPLGSGRGNSVLFLNALNNV